MTTPDITANGVVDVQAKIDRSGAVTAERRVATIPAATASGTNLGVVRFQSGFTPTAIAIVSEDLDTATNVTLDVGVIYDDTVEGTDDPNAFLDGIDIAQDAGSVIWPIADGLLTGSSLTTTGNGYIVVQTGGGATTTEGDITVLVQGTYDI